MELITKFLVIFITIFSLYMIYFYFRNKNKKNMRKSFVEKCMNELKKIENIRYTK